VAGPGSGLSKSIIILKKNKKNIILVKKKNQRVATGFYRFNRVNRVTPGFFFLYFSSTRPGSSPGAAGSRIDPSGRTGFQNYNMDAR
jgi:hypothetical protein